MSEAGPPVTPEIARRVADAWVKAWNDHDLEAILSHYADPLHFTSPQVVKRMGRLDGTLRSKTELREYFGQGLRAQPTLHFDLADVLVGMDSIALCYRNHRGQRAVEVMHLNDRGQIYRAVVQYAG
jgi:ketosteroid isomerase-like protein